MMLSHNNATNDDMISEITRLVKSTMQDQPQDSFIAAAHVGVVAAPTPTTNAVTNKIVKQGSDGRMLVNNEETLLIAVRDLRHLFVDPEKDPFSPFEVEIMGESGLSRIIRLLSSTSEGSLAPFYRVGHKHKLLIVLLPPEAIQADTAQKARDALTRYCELQIADNKKELYITKRQAGRLLWFGVGLLLVCMGLSLLFSSGNTPDALWTTTLSEGFNIIGWVFLWHPFEAYMYDPIPITIETRIFSFLNQMEIEIRPQTEISAMMMIHQYRTD
jgi:hypothetical protein